MAQQEAATSFAGLDEQRRKQAMIRFAVLRPHLEEGVPLTRAAGEAGIPMRTAERWLARYRQDGLVGLVRPARRDAGTHRSPAALVALIGRHPADLPSLGHCVQVTLRVRRFYCRNPGCARQTFAEQLPDLIAPHARRTGRLAKAQGRAGVALCGEAGARLLRSLSMPASADTALRLIRRLPLPEVEAPRVVAVDDWAVCKRRAYGTIVVDLERRRVVDLLADRTSPTVADWLRQRPGMEVVARDLAETRRRPQTARRFRRVCGWLDGTRPRRRPRRANGDPGLRPLAPAGQRARHAGALAGPCPRPPASPAAAARR